MLHSLRIAGVGNADAVQATRCGEECGTCQNQNCDWCPIITVEQVLNCSNQEHTQSQADGNKDARNSDGATQNWHGHGGEGIIYMGTNMAVCANSVGKKNVAQNAWGQGCGA